MGSASSQALVAGAAAVEATAVDLSTARELFAASRAVSGSAALSGALADQAQPAEARATLVDRVFAGISESARGLLRQAVAQRWSNGADFAAGIEELAIRAAAKADAADVEGELFQVSRIVAANPELELALGSKLGDAARKGELIGTILGGSASEATTLIVSSLVQQPGKRRVRSLLNRAMHVVAAQRGRTVATVHSAAALTEAQSTRLVAALSERYGGTVVLNTIVDPDVVGGIRVQVADDVIDGSISTRLADLRQRLAG